jgi:ISXO2-like transposase domain/Transposase zinc-ribbon domain
MGYSQNMESPKTLQAAIVFFANPDNCVAYMVAQRWPDGVVICPTCGRNDVSWLKAQRKWQCKSQHTKRQFSAKVGTIFEDSPIGLDKWLMAVWMTTNCKNGISSYEIARDLGVTQKSAWFMLHRIRVAMKDELSGKIGGGPVGVDETYIGGKIQNMHYSRKLKLQHIKNNIPASQSAGKYYGKTPIMGMLDRETRKVRAKVVPNTKRETLQNEILENIHLGSPIYTDQAVAYETLKGQFIHDTVNHLNEYVRGTVHTQGLENFWSLLKRSLKGTYVCVEPFHLDAYVDEQVFRFNNRHNNNDSTRFAKVVSQVTGKRLTYAEVTGKVAETAF